MIDTAATHPPPGPAGPAAAWRARCRELARWAFAHLLNRRDVWGAYLRPGRRPVRTRADGTTYEIKSYTAPAVRDRGRRSLDLGTLARHFAGRCPGDVVGLHSTSPGETSRWFAVDVDRHGDDGDPDANLRAVLHWYAVLRRFGFRPWLSDSNGAGGYHLAVVPSEPVPTPRAYRFIRRLVRDHARRGLAGRPETFPKQPGLSGLAFGNWLRLPGRHHTRDHWSRLWDGSRWLGGAEAVDFILAAVPDPAGLLPEIPEPPPPEHRPAPAAQPLGSPGRRMTEREVALKCLAAIPNAGCHFDDWLAVGMALASVEHSAEMLAAWLGWSRTSGKHTDGECERRWGSFGRGGGGGERRRTLGTLVHLARKAGRDPFPTPRVAARPSPPPAIAMGVRPALAGLLTVLPNARRAASRKARVAR